MHKIWHDEAWEDYLYWQTQDKKTLRRINNLIRDIDRNGYQSLGKPEALSGDLSGFWSVNYPPSALTLRGGGFVPLTRTQGRHMPAVPFDRDYVSSIPGSRGGRP